MSNEYLFVISTCRVTSLGQRINWYVFFASGESRPLFCKGANSNVKRSFFFCINQVSYIDPYFSIESFVSYVSRPVFHEVSFSVGENSDKHVTEWRS